MKITKRQLKRIIKEEKAHLLSEQSISVKVPSDYTDRLFEEMSSIWEYYASVHGLSEDEMLAKTMTDIDTVKAEFLAYMKNVQYGG